MVNIFNHALFGPSLILLVILYLIFSKIKYKFGKGKKCRKCKKGYIQLTNFEPITVLHFSGSGGRGNGGSAKVHGKATLKCSNCLDSYTTTQNR